MWDNFFYFTIHNSPSQSNWFKDYGSIIGNIITIGLFIIALYRDKGKERKKEEKTKTEKLKYLASLINSSIKTAKSNRQNVQETSDKFKKEPIKFHPIKVDNYAVIERIVAKLNLEEYYLAYITQFEKRKDATVEFQKTITSLDTLFQMFNELIKQSERVALNDFERKKIFNTLGDEIDKLIGKVLYIVEDFKMPETFKAELKEPIDKWSKEKNKDDVQLFLDTLCNPLYQLLSNFDSQNKQQTPTEFILLLEKLRSVVIEVEFIKSANIGYAESLDNQFGEINITIETLERNSKRLREYLENTDK